MSQAGARPVHNRRRLRATITLFALLLTAGLAWGVAAAFAGDSPSPAASAAPLTARFGTPYEADNLNPFIGYSGTSYEIFHLNYDFLVGYNTDLSPRPELATSWETSDDGLVWTFHLREGVKWQDGEPFTADDVVFTYRYIIDNDLSNFTSYTNNIDKIAAVDDLTVTMTCAKPKANMLRLWVPILPEHIWTKVSGKRGECNFTDDPPFMGPAPSGRRGQERLLREPRQVIPTTGWRQAHDRRDRHEQLPNPDTLTAGPQVRHASTRAGYPGDADQALGTEPDHHQRRQPRRLQRPLLELLHSAQLARQPRAPDAKFRQAINWAVDREKIVVSRLEGPLRAAATMVPPDHFTI